MFKEIQKVGKLSLKRTLDLVGKTLERGLRKKAKKSDWPSSHTLKFPLLLTTEKLLPEAFALSRAR